MFSHLSRRGPLSSCLLLSLCLSGCAASRGGTIPYDVKNFAKPDAPAAAVATADYRITAGDMLDIKVFQVEDLTKEYRVDPAGNISVPLVGSVPVVGKTTAEIGLLLEQRLNAKYLRDPDVTVAVKESNNRSVTIDGAVRRPGVFPTPPRLSLIQAVALAEGLDKESNPRRVAVFRQIGGQRTAAAFDLTSIRRGEAPDPEIYPGDIVVVDGTGSTSRWRDIVSTLPILALFRPY